MVKVESKVTIGMPRKILKVYFTLFTTEIIYNGINIYDKLK